MANIFDSIIGIECTNDDVPENVVSEIIRELNEKITNSRVRETDSLTAAIETAARLIADKKEDERSNGREACLSGTAGKRLFRRSSEGLTLVGGVGCGKTVAMKALKKLTLCEYVSMPALALMFISDGAEGVIGMINSRKNNNMIIDDLGSEQTVKTYGQKMPIEEIIMCRYNAWQTFGVMTHFSTNLSGKQLADRYGERISDRIREMTRVVVVSGKSLRGFNK